MSTVQTTTRCPNCSYPNVDAAIERGPACCPGCNLSAAAIAEMRWVQGRATDPTLATQFCTAVLRADRAERLLTALRTILAQPHQIGIVSTPQ